MRKRAVSEKSQQCLVKLNTSTLTNCWFSVSRHSKQIKIKIKTVQQIKSRIWEMKGGTYTKTLAKIQVKGIFRIRDIRRYFLPKFIEICTETPRWCSSGVNEFCYKSVNLFFEELINIEVMLSVIHKLFRQENSLK